MPVVRVWRRAAGRLPRDDGASAIETVLVGAVLLLLIFVCVQAGLYYTGRAVALPAAREGVSQLRLVQDEATAQDMKDDVERNIETYAVTVGRQSLLSPDARATYDDEGARVSMTVTGDTVSLVPG